MKSKLFFLLSFLILGPFCISAQAQFVHFRMEVENELSANVIQDLNFGEVEVNSGTNRIERGSAEMGIFQIRGLSNQRVLVTMDTPEELANSNPDIDDAIGLSLEYAYNNEGEDDVEEAQSFSGSTAQFRMGNTPFERQARWHSAFVYVFGNVEIDDVPEGTYEGTLILTVEYQ